MALLGEEESGTRAWGLVGLLGVFTGFLILSFYSVIGGWTLAYIFEGASGAVVNAGAEQGSRLCSDIGSRPLVAGAWHTVFITLTIGVVVLGVEQGLERAVRVLVPALVALLLVLLGYSMTSGSFLDGVVFLFEPRFEDLTGASVLAALGQAFFSLSVGMGAVMTYGAYLKDEESIPRASVAVVIADSSIALLAGLVIFPIAFAHGLDPAAGPGLAFQSLPLAFGQMPGGVIVATLFFLLLTFA